MTISVLFDLFGIREKEGNYVLFVVQANLVCGFLYLISIGLNFKNKFKESFFILSFAFLILAITFYFLKLHIDGGGIYEEKTVKAMTFRIIFTLVMAGLSFVFWKKHKR